MIDKLAVNTHTVWACWVLCHHRVVTPSYNCQRQRKRKNNNEGFSNLHIILLIHMYAFHWLKHVWLNRKDLLESMRGTTPEVAMVADVSGAYRAISCVYQCVTGPLWHEPLSFPLDVLDSDWSTKRKWRGPLNIDDLLWITS